MTKGAIYYSDCQADPRILRACRQQLIVAMIEGGVRDCVSVTLAPIDECLGTRIVLPLARGYLTMFRQILMALEASTADVIFHCEHDVLYHPSHFTFRPERDDTFYYNQSTWRVHAETGEAVFYLCNQVSGLCASRALLLEHYRRVVAHVEAHGFDRAIGFEPGTNRRQQALFGNTPVATWRSAGCNVDIKADRASRNGAARRTNSAISRPVKAGTRRTRSPAGAPRAVGSISGCLTRRPMTYRKHAKMSAPFLEVWNANKNPTTGRVYDRVCFGERRARGGTN
jgi:hypothetical protein